MSVLVQQSVKRTLFTMAFPMLAGTFAMNAYNLTDTYFVARLGTLPLAAMGFTFPVVMLLTFVAGGIGTGITTFVAHAIGRHDHADAARLVTHGFAFTMTTSAIISIAGYFTITPVFVRLGADEATLPLIRAFMHTWYVGSITMALPMIGNGILISMGDSRAASRFMIFGTVLNAILNPLLINGWLGLPVLGIRGSALATVIAQTASTLWLFRLLYRKHRLLHFAGWKLARYLETIRRILRFALPSVLSMMLMPMSATVITRLLSGFGIEAVAACGAAGRIEMFAFVIPMALGMSLMPFVSQNFGAGRLDRIREAKTLAIRFALSYGSIVTVVFFLGARFLAGCFTNDARVAAILVLYIRTISFGYGMMEVHRYCGFFLTGLHKPVSSTILNIIRVLALLIPLSYLGAHFFGIHGIFLGRLATDFAVGTIGIVWITRQLKAAPAPNPSNNPAPA